MQIVAMRRTIPYLCLALVILFALLAGLAEGHIGTMLAWAVALLVGVYYVLRSIGNAVRDDIRRAIAGMF
jgi:inner membrane protein involved in colicin E2 resistance